MSLTIRQYAFVFLVLVLVFIGLFGFYSYNQLTETRGDIYNSLQASAQKEFNSNFSDTVSLIKEGTEEFIHWQEVKQQFGR